MNSDKSSFSTLRKIINFGMSVTRKVSSKYENVHEHCEFEIAIDLLCIRAGWNHYQVKKLVGIVATYLEQMPTKCCISIYQ